MKVSYELEQGYIDVWNEESEEWDRYIKVNKKSVVEEKGIPEKIEEKEIEVSMAIGEQICANKINELIDYLQSKGE